MLTIFLLQIVLIAGIGGAEKNAPLAHIRDGSLKGRYVTTFNGRTISAFTAVPYAQPPIGDLRFKNPVPVKNWQGIKDATNTTKACLQDATDRSRTYGEEDCLYLNVYTPRLFKGDNRESYPVMFYMHGGSFDYDSGNFISYGPHYLLDKNIVLVTINYRLGIFGFLTTGDEASPGNYGLKDQVLALKWVQKNIREFGGDPDQVTIFGESAGAVSVHLHMASPQSQGLFHRAIMESGTIQGITEEFPLSDSIKTARIVGEAVNCRGNTVELVECLRRTDAIALVKTQEIRMTKWSGSTSYRPVIEPDLPGAFITKNPIDIIKSGKFNDVPLIIGMNHDEGAFLAAILYSNPTSVVELNNNFDQILPVNLIYGLTLDPKFTQTITDSIRKFYFNNRPLDNNSIPAVVKMYTDAIFLDGIDRTVRLHKTYSKSPIYYYLFNYRGSHSFADLIDPTRDYGVSHIDELFYLFQLNALVPVINPTESDKKMISLMTMLWTNFAITGNPTPKLNNLIQERWNPLRSDQLEYYSIELSSRCMRTNFFAHRAQFWRNLRNNLEKN